MPSMSALLALEVVYMKTKRYHGINYVGTVATVVVKR